MQPGMSANLMTGVQNGKQAIKNVENAQQADSEQNLRQVSQKFETAFTSALLKEQLKSAFSVGSGENTAAGSDTYVNFASEQIARYIGRQNVLGLSEEIREDLQSRKTEGENSNG